MVGICRVNDRQRQHVDEILNCAVSNHKATAKVVQCLPSVKAPEVVLASMNVIAIFRVCRQSEMIQRDTDMSDSWHTYRIVHLQDSRLSALGIEMTHFCCPRLSMLYTLSGL